jgi:hypothetical protein
MRADDWHPKRDQRVGAGVPHCRKGTLKLLWTADQKQLGLQPLGFGSGTGRAGQCVGHPCIAEDRDAPHLRYQRSKQAKLLPRLGWIEIGDARRIATGTVSIRNQTDSDRVQDNSKDNGNVGCRLLGCAAMHGTDRGNDIYRQGGKLGRKPGQPIKPAFGEARLDHDILAVNTALCRQPLTQRRIIGMCGIVSEENADAWC